LPPPSYDDVFGASGSSSADTAGALPIKGQTVDAAHDAPVAGAGVVSAYSPSGGGLFEVHVTRNMVAGAMLPLGIDVQLQHQLAAVEGREPMLANVLVKWVRPGGAAAQNGMVQSGDFIVTVQHVPVSLLTETQFFEHLRATTLVLGVSRPIRTI
jgi:hypothetical protein